jgi:hypothetical protein
MQRGGRGLSVPYKNDSGVGRGGWIGECWGVSHEMLGGGGCNWERLGGCWSQALQWTGVADPTKDADESEPVLCHSSAHRHPLPRLAVRYRLAWCALSNGLWVEGVYLCRGCLRTKGPGPHVL